VVHSEEQLAMLESEAIERPIEVYLKLNTGMNRLGFTAGAVPSMLRRLRETGKTASITLMTHFADADGDRGVEAPLAVFEAVARATGLPQCAANSAALIRFPQTHRDWVRPGIMLFGASPLRGRRASELGLRPAMSFETRLISVKPVPKGQRVGYGGHWVAPRNSLLGVAAAGYADGYPWHVGAGTPVGVRDCLAPVVGRVSMDMLTVDLTDVPGATAGDRVVLWGDGPTVEEVAGAARTIPWTLMTGINRRVAVRVDGGSTVPAQAPALVGTSPG